MKYSASTATKPKSITHITFDFAAFLEEMSPQELCLAFFIDVHPARNILGVSPVHG